MEVCTMEVFFQTSFDGLHELLARSMLPPKLPMVITFKNQPSGVCRQPVCACRNPWKSRLGADPIPRLQADQGIERVPNLSSTWIARLGTKGTKWDERLIWGLLKTQISTQQVKGWAPQAAGEKIEMVKTVRNSIRWTWGPTWRPEPLQHLPIGGHAEQHKTLIEKPRNRHKCLLVLVVNWMDMLPKCSVSMHLQMHIAVGYIRHNQAKSQMNLGLTGYVWSGKID